MINNNHKTVSSLSVQFNISMFMEVYKQIHSPHLNRVTIILIP